MIARIEGPCLHSWAAARLVGTSNQMVTSRRCSDMRASIDGAPYFCFDRPTGCDRRGKS